MNYRIDPIVGINLKTVDFALIKKIMSSPKISDKQKTQFLRSNRVQISNVMKEKITSSEFRDMMKNRPLQKFRPIKNSFTKAVDKRLLAQSLGILPNEVAGYTKEVAKELMKINAKSLISPETIDKMKTYVYRHGTKDEVIQFLDYELSQAKDLIKTLYSTLEYYSGGVADYYIRPIHRMDNATLVKTYNVIDKNLKVASECGQVTDADRLKLAEWSLIRIYEIQNNSKLINAIKTYNELK